MPRAGVDAAREAARNKTTGQFGEQQLADPGQTLLQAVPEPPEEYLAMVWRSINQRKTTGSPQPATLAGLRDAIASDLPGLTAEQRDWFTNQVLRYGDAWLRCIEVMRLPGGASWSAIRARIPESLQNEVPRKTFRVRDDSGCDFDPDTGRPTGRTFTRYGSNDEWVDALASRCEHEIGALAERARAASDANLPTVRRDTHPDPWLDHVDNPTF